jgi:hypothetical protein
MLFSLFAKLRYLYTIIPDLHESSMLYRMTHGKRFKDSHVSTRIIMNTALQSRLIDDV